MPSLGQCRWRRYFRRRSAIAAGEIVAAYKVCGQHRAVAILDVASHDELDRLAMAGLPMSHLLQWDEVAAVREYKDFAGDARQRWP